MTTNLSVEAGDRVTSEAEITVAYLADYPQYIRLLADWHHATWHYLSPNTTLNDRIHRLRTNAQRGRIPMTLVALRGEGPVGCASLISNDMADRQHLSPWLASVFVVPHERNAGVGSQLVVRAVEEAGAIGHKRIFLYTPDRQTFYTRLGWHELETREYRGFQMTIMQYDLVAPVDSQTT